MSSSDVQRSARRRARRARAATVLPLVVVLGAACSRSVPADDSPLEGGAVPPAEFATLRVVQRDGAPSVVGAFRHGGRTVRFSTARGPAIAWFEVAEGANPYEIDVCFVSESGTPLVSVAGGHAITIPECHPGDAEPAVASPEEAQADMAAAYAAMDALAALPFKPTLHAEQKTLTGARGFRPGTHRAIAAP